MVKPEDITVCYAVTPDLPYPRCAAASMYSAARATPGVRVRLVEVDGGDYPWGVHVKVLPVDCPSDWVMVLNADIWVNGDLCQLVHEPYVIRLRISRAWKSDRLDTDNWFAILAHFGLPPIPVYSNNFFVCEQHVAGILHHGLDLWMKAIVHCGLPDPLNRDLIKKDVPEWWMRDQFALSLIVALENWDVDALTPQELSWNFARESGGIVHHIGTDVDPFGVKEWPTYVKT